MHIRALALAIVLNCFQPTIFGNDQSEPVPTSPAVEIEFRELQLRRPPLAELYFDMVLRNHRKESIWFILPSNLSPNSQSHPAKGGVDGVEVFATQGKQRVIIGHFQGTGGFRALLLPANGKVRLRLFPISFWGDVPDSLQVEVLTATKLTIGGEEAEAWFGENPLSSTGAEIEENPLSPTRMVRSRHTLHREEVERTLSVDSRFQMNVSLKPRQ